MGLLHVFTISSKFGFGFSAICVVLSLVGGLFVNFISPLQEELPTPEHL
jgi:hypothetical protein